MVLIVSSLCSEALDLALMRYQDWDGIIDPNPDHPFKTDFCEKNHKLIK